MTIRVAFGRIIGVAAITAIFGLGGVAKANEIPAGTEIHDGIAVHITPKGVGFMENQIPYLVPDEMDVPQQQGTLFSCLFDTADWKIKNTKVYIDVGKVSITPLEGKLKLHLELTVSATARVETNGCLFNNGCNVVLPASPVVADTLIDMAMVIDPVTGRPKVDATTEQFAISLGLADPEINGCFLGDVLEFILGIFGGLVEDAIVGAINDQVGPLLEPAIEDAFNSLNLKGELDLGGSKVEYDFYPVDLAIHPGTIGLLMGGAFTSPGVAPCADPTRGSNFTAGALPIFTNFSPSSQPYDVAASVSDDLLNQLVFSAWRGGLLCRTIDEIGGAPLTTSLLTLLGGSITRIVTPDGPMVISLVSPEPPLVTLGGGNTANLSLSNLKINIMADVQDRLARVMELTLSPTAGLNVSMNADNQIVAALNFDPAQLNGQVSYNELAPDANDAILNLLPTLVEQLLPNLTDAIPPIDIPDLGGVTVDYAEITPDGASQDFLSLYTGLGGQVSAGGCAAGGTGGGCGVGGGGLGCSVNGPHAPGRLGRRGLNVNATSPLLLLIGVAAVVARRRKT